MEVEWSAQFFANVQHALRTIRKDNPDAAERLFERIRDAERLLSEHPEVGVTHRRLAAVRTWKISSYRVHYRVEDERLVLLAFWHARRGEPDLTSR